MQENESGKTQRRINKRSKENEDEIEKINKSKNDNH